MCVSQEEIRTAGRCGERDSPLNTLMTSRMVRVFEIISSKLSTTPRSSSGPASTRTREREREGEREREREGGREGGREQVSDTYTG